MDDSLIVAKLLGTYLIISGLFLILRGKTLPNILKDFFNHPAIVYLTGVLFVILSSLYLIQNNIWDGTWRTTVTVLAWTIFLKGVSYIFIPETLHKIVSKKLMQKINLYGVAAVIVGLSLFYIG